MIIHGCEFLPDVIRLDDDDAPQATYDDCVLGQAGYKTPQAHRAAVHHFKESS
jgi:hypothetical protein